MSRPLRPIVAALAGAVIEIRRNRWRGALLVLFPVVLFLYMGSQTRYFGRWLLPMYPVLALLAAVALVQLVLAWVWPPTSPGFADWLAAVT